MADDTKSRGAPDRDRINLGQEHEVRYWTETLGLTKEQLQAAVYAVGSSPDRVREHIRGFKR